ncbi:kinase-like domain-containing protein [Rhizophagus clarus]|uniref:Kinase-like domain-containing protein n=1 Tax=Rhizophagus clarus TaxID=94130 RepID=A0A8H3QGK9_9GLOM|nr:kinase-like domain-containing protein [Rhizophagus clarus]
MSTLRYELIYATNNRAFMLIAYAIRLLTKNYDRDKVMDNDGGFSEIYTADWINGCYEEWDSENQQLKRIERPGLQNIVKFFDVIGLTQNPSNGSYNLVMMKMNMDLKKYLQQNHNRLTLKDRIRVAYQIILALYCKEKICGPADKPLTSIYGNLSYIAPEVIAGRKYTFASDIYSIAILMWEISSGKPPFVNYKHDDYDLAMDIISLGTPLEYINLTKECWDANPLNRPDSCTLEKKMKRINLDYQNMPDELFQLETNDLGNIKANNLETNYTSSSLFTSKIHNFENLPKPRNATKEEQEAFHSKSYDFNIPDNINDFTGSNSKQNSKKQSKIINIFKGNNKRISKEFKKLQISSNDDEKEIIHQKIKRQNINIDDDDEIYSFK